MSLAVGQRIPSLPQRLLGKDLFWWLYGVGFMKVSTDSRLGRKLAKRDVLIGSSARALRRSGVTLRGRLTSASGRRVVFEDGTEHDIDAIIWATGYRSDYSWIDIPAIKGADGAIIHRRGVTAAAGLFFVGIPWQHTRGSALIGFVQDDAAFIAGRIESQLGDPGRTGRNRANLSVTTPSAGPPLAHDACSRRCVRRSPGESSWACSRPRRHSRSGGSIRRPSMRSDSR